VAVRYIQLTHHDATHLELHVTPDNYVLRQRFSVLVPQDTLRDVVIITAHKLAAYVKLVDPTAEVVFDRNLISQSIRQLRQRAAPRQQFYYGGARAEVNQYQMEPTAEEKALALLKQIDPVLADRMQEPHAFYFATTDHTYIWFPNERAIISLDDDFPHYVCVHSRDATVERNKYDWAITMRTYLLGAETHWRSTANFHLEHWLRGGRNAYRNDVRES
jgi:hypothetical protein